MNYKQVYAKHFGNSDWLPCEVCGMQAVDIHHILYKSQGGKDNIENLIGLCRIHHDCAHFKREPYLHKEELQEIHNKNL